jgi:hypothetical protein
MTMSRKQYRAFAAVIRAEVDGLPNLLPRNRNAAGAAIASLAHNLAIVLKEDNSAFRYDTFFEAAGLDGFGNIKKVPAARVARKPKAAQSADAQDGRAYLESLLQL